MNPLINSWLSYRETPPQMETNTKKSMTQPNEVMSIRQMLMRHVRGLPVDSPYGEGTYLGDEIDIPEMRGLDLTEIQDMRDHFREQINAIHKKESDKKEKAKPDPKQQREAQPSKTPAEGGKPPESGGQLTIESKEAQNPKSE